MKMHIGVLTVTLYLHAAESLKHKRSVIKSLIETTRRKFNVSIAEVADLDKWQRSTIGIAFVANDVRFLNGVMDTVVNHLESCPEFEVGEVDLELM